MDSPAPADASSTNPAGNMAGLRFDSTQFLYQLTVVTLSLILLYLVLILLEKFRAILQPLFIAVFIGYLILPVHRWLVERRVPSNFAYVVILVLILGTLFGLGTLLYRNVEQVIAKLPGYEDQVENFLRDLNDRFHLNLNLEGAFLRELSLVDFNIMATLGRFQDFFTAMAITFIYLVFLVAEKVSLTRRLTLAFGEQRGQRVLKIVESINQAISEYIAVKTFVSFLASIFSMAVLAIFQVDFFITWGILIFLLNFIPYIGSLVAVAPPIGLSFLMLQLWQAIVVTLLLVAIQQVIGALVEPRMAGRRLGVSPLLILLSLAFWGLVWGIVGMILAVPLLMTIKIILENIKETRPLATLMSNQ